MKRTTHTIAIAVLSVALAACGKDKKDDAKAAGTAAELAAVAGGSAVSSSKINYALFPADAEFVAAFAFDGIRKSALWTRVAPMFEAKMNAELGKIKEACGLDPLTKFTSAVVAGKPGDEKSMVVVLKGFTKAELTSCGTAMAKKEGKEVTITEEDGLTKIHHDSEDMYVAWVDDTTAVMSPHTDKAWVKARAAGQGGLDGNAEFMTLLKSVDTSATVFFAAKPTAGGDMDLSKSLPGAQAVFGSLKITDGLGIDGGVRFDTADNAKAALAQATQGIQAGKGMLPPAIGAIADKVKLATPANDLTLHLELTAADLQAIQAMLAPMLGGMMGGMEAAGEAPGGSVATPPSAATPATVPPATK